MRYTVNRPRRHHHVDTAIERSDRALTGRSGDLGRHLTSTEGMRTTSAGTRLGQLHRTPEASR